MDNNIGKGHEKEGAELIVGVLEPHVVRLVIRSVDLLPPLLLRGPLSRGQVYCFVVIRRLAVITLTVAVAVSVVVEDS